MSIMETSPSSANTTIFDEETFIQNILNECLAENVNFITVYNDYYRREIGFGTITEKQIISYYQAIGTADSPIYTQSLYALLMNKVDDKLIDYEDSDAETDTDD
jgi:hypothetical protein